MLIKGLRSLILVPGTGLVLFACAFSFDRPLRPIENLIYDVMMRASAQPFERSAPLTLVDVDEYSLSVMGQWPWPRNQLATLVDRVNEGGADVLAFDAIFAEPDRMSPDRLIDALQAEDAGYSWRLEGEPPSFDERFAQAIQRAPVVLGQTSLTSEQVLAGAAPQERSFKPRPTINLRATDPSLPVDGPPPGAYRLTALLSNIPQLDEAASGLGVVTLPADNDGVARALPLVFGFQDATLPSLALETLRVSQQARGLVVRFDRRGIRDVIIQGSTGTLVLPTDRAGRLRIRFPTLPRGEDRYFRVVSAADVLADGFDPQVFAGEIVLFGSSAAGLFDLKSTPLGADAQLPGMELQALTLHQSLVGDMIRPRDATAWALVAATVFFLYAAVLLPRLPSLLNSAVWLAAVAAILSLQLWFFVAQATYVSLLNLLLFVLVFGGFALVTDLLRRDQHRREIKTAFAHYLSPALVRQISRNPEQLKLGGERKDISVLFADLRDFTAVSETFKDDPEKLTSILNAILTPLTDIVHDHRGTVDKYMGDCLMAFWNAPLDVDNHADEAVKAAIAMAGAMPEINARIRAQFGHDGFKLGLGVNTGQATVGNLGSTSRFDYSVLGDAVNLASRLEGQTKVYGVDIIVGQASDQQLSDPRLQMIQIDELRVVGKTEPVKIYTPLNALLPDHAHQTAPRAEDLAAHARGLQAYQHAEAEEAVAAIDRLQGLFGGALDAVYALWRQRRTEAAAQGKEDGRGPWQAPTK